MRERRVGREAMEVEGGGRIVRSIGGKDRQSKVCTSKGAKDRRIRLSAKTAIQFYDVQDRLGYDQPSKAIDWLMKEAKVAIDALNTDHHQESLVPATTTIFNPSESFRRTHHDQNQHNWNHDQTSSFDNYPFGLISSRNRCQTEQGNPIIVPAFKLFSASPSPLDFTSNPNYNSRDGFAFVSREAHPSSFSHPIAHTSNNEYASDDGLLGFSFQQEIHGKDTLVSEHCQSSENSLLH